MATVGTPKNAMTDVMPKAETKAAKKPVDPAKLRAIIGGAAFGVVFAAQALANKDDDSEGIDDYFAGKLQQIALDMQSYAFTGKTPSGFAG